MKNDAEQRLILEVDLASSLKAAFCAAGWNTDQVKKLAQGDYLHNMRSVVEGYSEVTPRNFTIDLGATPKKPDSRQFELELVAHQGTGTAVITRKKDRLFLDGKMVNLFVAKCQRKKGGFTRDMQNAVKDMKVANVNLGEFLIRYPFLVPEPWYKFRQIFLWGTRYKSSIGAQYVAALEMPHVTDIHISYHEITHQSGFVFSTDCPSAILAK